MLNRDELAREVRLLPDSLTGLPPYDPDVEELEIEWDDPFDPDFGSWDDETPDYMYDYEDFEYPEDDDDFLSGACDAYAPF